MRTVKHVLSITSDFCSFFCLQNSKALNLYKPWNNLFKCLCSVNISILLEQLKSLGHVSCSPFIWLPDNGSCAGISCVYKFTYFTQSVVNVTSSFMSQVSVPEWQLRNYKNTIQMPTGYFWKLSVLKYSNNLESFSGLIFILEIYLNRFVYNK